MGHLPFSMANVSHNQMVCFMVSSPQLPRPQELLQTFVRDEVIGKAQLPQRLRA